MGSVLRSLKAGITTPSLMLTGLTPNALVKADETGALVTDTTTYSIGVGTRRITVSETEPSDPEEGDIWIDLSQ